MQPSEILRRITLENPAKSIYYSCLSENREAAIIVNSVNSVKVQKELPDETKRSTTTRTTGQNNPVYGLCLQEGKIN